MGMTLKEVVRRLGVFWGTASRRIAVLEAEGKVKCRV
jgi:Mn-dependent DtxR family transcriptional regulator